MFRDFRAVKDQETGTPEWPPDNEDGIVSIPGVSIVRGNLRAESNGTLHITSSKVKWLCEDDRKGYEFDFSSVSLHGISKDPESYPFPCLYLQIECAPQYVDNLELEESNLDSGLGNGAPLSGDRTDINGYPNGVSEDESSFQTEEKNIEIRLVPSDPGQLDTIFHLFCERMKSDATPDETMEDGEDISWDLSEDYEEDEEGLPLSHQMLNPIGHPNGTGDLPQTLLQLQINDKRFEDAKDDMNHHSS